MSIIFLYLLLWQFLTKGLAFTVCCWLISFHTTIVLWCRLSSGISFAYFKMAYQKQKYITKVHKFMVEYTYGIIRNIDTIQYTWRKPKHAVFHLHQCFFIFFFLKDSKTVLKDRYLLKHWVSNLTTLNWGSISPAN